MHVHTRAHTHTHSLTQPVEISDDSLSFFTYVFIYAAYEYACDIFVSGGMMHVRSEKDI